MDIVIGKLPKACLANLIARKIQTLSNCLVHPDEDLK